MSKEQEAVSAMEKQFKRGLVSAEAMVLLDALKEKLDAFDSAVLKKCTRS